jgi:hypothetical protein
MRCAAALGYSEAWTYTLPEESGISLRAAGFEEMGISRGGEHDRPSRRRALAEQPGPKRRWRRQLCQHSARHVAIAQRPQLEQLSRNRAPAPSCPASLASPPSTHPATTPARAWAPFCRRRRPVVANHASVEALPAGCRRARRAAVPGRLGCDNPPSAARPSVAWALSAIYRRHALIVAR